MTTPATKDIQIRFGDTKIVTFRVRERVWDAGTGQFVDGDYRDLTGYTITAQARQDSEAADPLFVWTVTLGDQTDLTSGRGLVTLKVSSTVTSALLRTLSSAVYDVQFEEPNGDIYTYVAGAITFTKDVTR